MSDTITDNPAGESRVKLFGYETSLRGIIAFMLTLTLCASVLLRPDVFYEVFTYTVTAVIAFYFGQKSNK